MSNQVEVQSVKKNKSTLKKLIYDAVVRRNIILAGGMVIAPVVVFADNTINAVTLAAVFSFITFFTLLISSFVPQNIVYTIRIILYTLIGALIYVPSVIIFNSIMPEQIENMGVFFPLLITNSLIVSRSETTFFLENKSQMLLDIFFSIIGYDIVVVLFGLFREIISSGEFNGNILAVPFVYTGFSNVYGGFIMLGVAAALFRGILLAIRKIKS